MKIKLPRVIEAYILSSNESDIENFMACFSDTAKVMDEGETFVGHKDIKKWFAKTRRQYQFKSEPLEIKDGSDHIIMKTKVSGTFPGSPITLNYHFQIKAGLIQELQFFSSSDLSD